MCVFRVSSKSPVPDIRKDEIAQKTGKCRRKLLVSGIGSFSI